MDGVEEKELDYRAILRRSLELRCRRNPRYSLRAFARDLGLSPASLSEIFQGKQGLSVAAADRIGRALGLAEDQRVLFRTLVESRHARSEVRRLAAAKRLRALQESMDGFVLKEDVFALVADWYHLPLLELLRYSGKGSDAAWLARRLKITKPQVEQAVRLLARLGLISVENGGVRVLQGFVSTVSAVPSEAIRENHRQVLRKAVEAIDGQGIDQRDFAALKFAFDPRKMAEAKKALKSFRRKFLRAFEYQDEQAEIYCLSMQLFALTEAETE